MPPPVSDSPLPPLEEEEFEVAGAAAEEQESVYSSAEDLLDPIMRSRRPNAKFTNTPVKVINPREKRETIGQALFSFNLASLF